MKLKNYNIGNLVFLLSFLAIASCQDKKLEKVDNDFSVTTTFGGSYQIDTA